MTVRCPCCKRNVRDVDWRVKRTYDMFDPNGRPVAIWRCPQCHARIVRGVMVGEASSILAAG